jgi:hypothetical protein
MTGACTITPRGVVIGAIRAQHPVTTDVTGNSHILSGSDANPDCTSTDTCHHNPDEPSRRKRLTIAYSKVPLGSPAQLINFCKRVASFPIIETLTLTLTLSRV